jgi:glycerol-3-phosphate dehydrogenase
VNQTHPARPPVAPPGCPDGGERCDVLVVGGGINGAGIARDLAGRGLKVMLCEQDDLASHTSSSSTKLIHGGLRYLEFYEFSLVRKALAEREVLLRSAPHIMWPLRFVMPHDPSMRPAWMIRAGLFLYDHLARREVLPGSCAIDLRRHVTGAPLRPNYTKGFVYSDAWVDDARLVVLNAVDAAARGATVLTRTACIEARRDASSWHATLREAHGQERRIVARALVNATGPWAAQFLAEHVRAARSKPLRLVKGSHIVVRRLFEHDHAYLFQNPDKRIIFAIPYEGDFTLIGTTDIEHTGAIGSPRIDDAEVAYLCEQASRYFVRALAPADVVWSYSGVRPLLDDESGDPSAVTRDYALELSQTLPASPAGSTGVARGLPGGAGVEQAAAPLLNVWGGKITTFRKLAEEAGDLLATSLQAPRGAWTGQAFLPGGDLSPWIGTVGRPDTGFARFVDTLAQRHPALPAALVHRLARAYGGRAVELLEGVLGAQVAPGLHEAELHFLHEHEWARHAEDVLWRRSKLGLHYDATARAAVQAWCERHWGSAAGATVREQAWS